jgi:hypothetical protein
MPGPVAHNVVMEHRPRAAIEKEIKPGYPAQDGALRWAGGWPRPMGTRR